MTLGRPSKWHFERAEGLFKQAEEAVLDIEVEPNCKEAFEQIQFANMDLWQAEAHLLSMDKRDLEQPEGLRLRQRAIGINNRLYSAGKKFADRCLRESAPARRKGYKSKRRKK